MVGNGCGKITKGNMKNLTIKGFSNHVVRIVKDTVVGDEGTELHRTKKELIR